MSINPTTSLRKITELVQNNPGARVYAIVGGMSSSKTFSILMLLINHCLSEANTEILVVSHQLSKAKLTVIKDFKYILNEFGIWDESRFRGETEYTFPNGSQFKFVGADRTDLGKGLRVRGITYINEANRLAYETYRQLSSRSPKTILDWNADYESYIEKYVLPLEDTAFLRLTIYDNEMAPENELREVESYKEQGFNQDGSIKNEFFANLYNVYGLGLTGRAIGAVYQNWTIGDYVHVDGCEILGLDFGFSKDPDALVRVSVDKRNKIIYIKEELYSNGLSEDKLGYILKEKAGNQLIAADSAEDRLISDLKAKYKVKIFPVKKPKIVESIKQLQEYKFIVDPNSLNVQKELNAYIWIDGKDKTMPLDKNNHALDALRYSYVSLNQPVVRKSSVIITQ